VSGGWGDGPPGPPPRPPQDLQARDLPIEVVRAGTILSRIHRTEFGPIVFGPAPGAAPGGRWDAPAGEFRVCYLAEEPQTAFAETFLRMSGETILDPADVADRSLAEVIVMRDLRLAAMSGRGLARMGTTAAVCSGPYAASREWARVVHDHPARPDGIRYRARHDDDGYSLALFDRAADAIEESATQPLAGFRMTQVLGGWLDRYGVAVA
jgi:hypothetical protein